LREVAGQTEMRMVRMTSESLDRDDPLSGEKERQMSGKPEKSYERLVGGLAVEIMPGR